MKKLLFIIVTSLSVATAYAASDKDTAAVVKDEKVGNSQDKKAVKKASSKDLENAKEEAAKTSGEPSKGHAGSTGSSK